MRGIKRGTERKRVNNGGVREREREEEKNRRERGEREGVSMRVYEGGSTKWLFKIVWAQN